MPGYHEFTSRPRLLGQATRLDQAITLQDAIDIRDENTKLPVRVLAAANQVGAYNPATQTFTYDEDGALEIDGRLLAAGNRLALKGQSTPSQNGVFVVADVGSGSTPAVIKRASDFNVSSEVRPGVRINIDDGDTFKNTTWRIADFGAITLDTSPIVFEKVIPARFLTPAEAIFDGDNATATFNLEHGLGNHNAVVLSVRNTVTRANVVVDWDNVDDDTIALYFEVPPLDTATFHVVFAG